MSTTEKEYLETQIKHLLERKRLTNAAINFKVRMLEEALALQDGFEVGGKHGYLYETFEEG